MIFILNEKIIHFSWKTSQKIQNKSFKRLYVIHGICKILKAQCFIQLVCCWVDAYFMVVKTISSQAKIMNEQKSVFIKKQFELTLTHMEPEGHTT